MYILGIDGGGTKTTGILVDPDGNVLALATVEATNPQSIEEHVLETRLSQLINSIREQSGEALSKTSTVFAGVSGADRPREKQLFLSLLSKYVPQQAAIEIDNDGVNALFSGTQGRSGIVNIAGTGALSFGINKKGERGRVGGWGYLIGDPGSGYAIGLAALKSVFQSYDQCGEKTLLTEMILAHTQHDQIPQLIGSIYEAGKSRFFIASLCPVVIQAADQGDPAAMEILTQAAKDMANSINCLIRKLFHEEKGPIPVVLVGGVYAKSEWFVPQMEEELVINNLNAEFILSTLPPVVGTVYAARKSQGLNIDTDYTKRLEESIMHFNKGVK